MKITARQLAKRVETWKKRLDYLGLEHWRIDSVGIVEEVPDAPNSVACVQTAHLYDNFRVWFQADYVENADEDDLDETIIHELVHVAMRGLDRTYEQVEDWMPKHTYTDFMVSVGLEREAFVERITRTIYKLHAGSENGWRQQQPR